MFTAISAAQLARKATQPQTKFSLEMLQLEAAIKKAAVANQLSLIYNATIVGNPSNPTMIIDIDTLTGLQLDFYTVLVQSGYTVQRNGRGYWFISWSQPDGMLFPPLTGPPGKDGPPGVLTPINPSGSGAKPIVDIYGRVTSFTDLDDTDITGGLGFTPLDAAGGTIDSGEVTSLDPVLDIKQTWNNPAVPFTAVRVDVTDTDSDSGSLLLDLQVDGLSVFSVDKLGSATLVGSGDFLVGPTSPIGWTGRSRMKSSADGMMTLSNEAGTNFYRLMLGGITSSYPSLKRNGAGLDIRLADDSDFADLRAYNITAGIAGSLTFNSRSSVSSPADGRVLLSNNAGSGFDLLQFGGTSTSFPALKRSGTQLQVRLANDSNYADLRGAGFIGTSLTLSGGTVSSSSPVVNVTQTWNDGATDFTGALVNITNTTSASGSKILDLQVGGTSMFNVSVAGHTTIPATSGFVFNSRGRIIATADGKFQLTDAAQTSVNMLQFGGSTSLFPAFKRSSAELQSRLADDSGYAGFRASTVVATASIAAGASNSISFSGRTLFTAPVDGNLRITNNAETTFGLLQFGGTTSSFPALKLNGTGLDLRLADDSGYASFAAGTITSSGALVSTSSEVSASGTFSWTGRSKISSSADGYIRLANAADADFGLLQFGGSTNLFPALKRNTTELFVRLADDSGYAGLRSSTFVASSNIATGAASSLGFTARTIFTSPVDGNLRITNNAGTSLGLIQLGGATSSFPALKRNAAGLDLRLADDSGYASFAAGTITSSGALVGTSSEVSASGTFSWTGRSKISSSADGYIRLANAADADFTMLRFGGDTASFPGLKRNLTGIDLRLADDTAYAPLGVSNIGITTGTITASSPALNITQTWNNAAIGFVGIQADFTSTASATASYLMDLKVGGTSQFIVRKDGIVSIGATGSYMFSGRSRITSGSDGNIVLSNSTLASFGLLQLGGATSSFPALKRSTTTVQVRLADDSGDASLSAANLTASAGITAYSATAVPAGGTTGSGIKMSSTADLGVFFGSGVPTLSAAQGSLYLRTDGSGTGDRMYVNTDGGTTWTSVTTAT